MAGCHFKRDIPSLVAFDILEDVESLPPGCAKSSGHILFDVKMEFTWKVRWVKGVHFNTDPETLSHS